MGHAARLAALVLGAAALGGGLTQPASAVTMVAIYTGTVLTGSDRTNVFGAGTNLDGLAFRMTFAYDPETPGASRTTDADRDEVFGGPASGFTSPMRSAKLTINKHTERFRTDTAGVSTYNIGTYSVVAHDAIFELSDTKISKISELRGFADSSSARFLADLDASVPRTSLSLAGDPSGIGHFFIGECAFNSAGGCDATVRTIGTLAPSSLAIAPIPAPAALPLLMSCLAALGFAGLRMRHNGQATAA